MFLRDKIPASAPRFPLGADFAICNRRRERSQPGTGSLPEQYVHETHHELMPPAGHRRRVALLRTGAAPGQPAGCPGDKARRTSRTGEPQSAAGEPAAARSRAGMGFVMKESSRGPHFVSGLSSRRLACAKSGDNF